MALTPAQLATLKASILADPVLAALPNTPDDNWRIADAYNAAASPGFTVWKSLVPIGEVGKKFNGAELAGLTSGNQSRLQTLAVYFKDGVNPSLTDTRAFFDDVFSGSGGATTRANLLALWKRLATRVEKLFATGAGSDASPATMGFEGRIYYTDVEAARALP